MKNIVLTIAFAAFAFVAPFTSANAKTKVFVKNDTIIVKTSDPEINSAVYDTHKKKWVAAVQRVDGDTIVWSTTGHKAKYLYLTGAADWVADYGNVFAINANFKSYDVFVRPVKVVCNH